MSFELVCLNGEDKGTVAGVAVAAGDALRKVPDQLKASGADAATIQAAWEPIYWEDTSFKACAPADNDSVRAPVHYYQGGAAASYCEEVYPTAHHYDPNTFPSASTAHRTTKSEIHADFLCSGNCEQYPLQAPVEGIEQALLKTQSYGCVATSVTGHPDLVGKQFPAACCASISLSCSVT